MADNWSIPRRKALQSIGIGTVTGLSGCVGFGDNQSQEERVDELVEDEFNTTDTGPTVTSVAGNIKLSGEVTDSGALLYWGDSSMTIKNNSSKRVLTGRATVGHPEYDRSYTFYNVQKGVTKTYFQDFYKGTKEEMEERGQYSRTTLDSIFFEDKNKIRYREDATDQVRFRVEEINSEQEKMTISFPLPEAVSFSPSDIEKISGKTEFSIKNGRVSVQFESNFDYVDMEKTIKLVTPTDEQLVYLKPPVFEDISVSDVSVSIKTSNTPYQITEINSKVSLDGTHQIFEPNAIVCLARGSEFPNFYSRSVHETAFNKAKERLNVPTNVVPASPSPDKFAQKTLTDSGTVSFSTERSIELPINENQMVTVILREGQIPIAYQDSAPLSEMV